MHIIILTSLNTVKSITLNSFLGRFKKVMSEKHFIVGLIDNGKLYSLPSLTPLEQFACLNSFPQISISKFQFSNEGRELNFRKSDLISVHCCGENIIDEVYSQKFRFFRDSDYKNPLYGLIELVNHDTNNVITTFNTDSNGQIDLDFTTLDITSETGFVFRFNTLFMKSNELGEYYNVTELLKLNTDEIFINFGL